MSWTPKLPLSGPSLSQLFDHIGLVSKPKLMCQPLKPPHLLRQSVRILFTCTLAVYILSTMKVSALDDSDFFPMKSLMFRQFAHRRPQISPFERPGRDPDRTCGVLLTKRTQRICSLDCPPPGMNHEKKKHHNIGQNKDSSNLVVLDKRATPKTKTLLTSLCCDKACSDDVIRQIFCCAGP